MGIIFLFLYFELPSEDELWIGRQLNGAMMEFERSDVNEKMEVEKVGLESIKIMKGSVEEARDFARLMLISSPVLFPIFFGKNALQVLEKIYREPNHLFSVDHVWFAKVNDEKIIGMILIYDWRQKQEEETNTGKILIKTIPITMLKNVKLHLMIRNLLGVVKSGELYISNVAVYRKYRGKGIGTRLLTFAEETAREKSAKKLSLEVETENTRAKLLYERLGFKIEWKTPKWKYKGKILEFYRIVKNLPRDNGGKARRSPLD